MLNTCVIDGCEKPVHGRGWCKAHYIRWERHGDPKGGGIARGSTQAFIDSAIQYDSDDCLLWPYSQNEHGYGKTTVEGKTVRAHRVVCTIAHGNPPTAKHQAAHSCGVKLCCNPAHLRWATRVENEADKLLHGTDQHGEKNHRVKLTARDVLEIRNSIGNLSQGQLAEKYGVSRQTICDVQLRKRWAWLDDAGSREAANV